MLRKGREIVLLPLHAKGLRVDIAHESPHAAAKSRTEGRGRNGTQAPRGARKVHCLRNVIPEEALRKTLRSIDLASERRKILTREGITSCWDNLGTLGDEVCES